MADFERYIGIDYSGAETPTASLKGLRVYLAEGTATPTEVHPPPSPRKYWTRRGIAEWLVERLDEDAPTLVGIDHGFSFPRRYFESYGLKSDWSDFLEDFCRHWPTDEDHVYVDFVRDGNIGNAAARTGSSRWRRLVEELAGAKSVFHFDVQGQVAKSTHAGIPWLQYIRERLGAKVHFWPFDGWDVPEGRSAVAEVYPRLWSQHFAREDRSGDQHDAFCITAWMAGTDRDGDLTRFLKPDLGPTVRAVAEVEGWILGVPGEHDPKAVARASRPRVGATHPSDRLLHSRTRKGRLDVGAQRLQDSDEIAGLLQSLEHAADMIGRLCQVLDQLVSAGLAGRPVDPAVLRDYAAQLETVAGQRQRLQEAIVQWWAVIGRDQAH